jgi:hypothetical protein
VNISNKLYLVVPIYDDAGEKVVAHVHAEPISSQTFDRFYLVFAKTQAAIYSEGLGTMAGPRVAAKLLRTVSESLGSAQDVSDVLLADMRRLTTLVEPGQPAMMIEDALRAKKISQEDFEEVENAVTFFTVVLLMLPKPDRRKELEMFSKLWGAATSSLNSTEYVASLSTSTAPANTGASPTPSSIPH